MSKAALSSLISEEFDLSKAMPDKIITKVFEGIVNSLESQGSFSYVGFGSLVVVDRKARPGRNPATGVTMEIAARKSIKFKVGEHLKKKINP